MESQQVTYVNVFRVKGYAETQVRTLNSDNSKKCFEYRGVTVYKNFRRSFDYVYDGVCITQRMGCSNDCATEFVDRFLANDQRNDIQRAISIYCRGKGIEVDNFNPVTH